jgi:two-component system chemotaxis sensor kinase CheA
MSDFLISPELLNIYIEDARGHLDALDNCLLALEREGFDPETLSGALGPLHTLKGNSGMMGFAGIKEFVHRLEDVFAQVIGGRVGLGPEAFDRLFACASALRGAVEEAAQHAGERRSFERERESLDALLASPQAPAPALPSPAPLSPPATAPTLPAARAEAEAGERRAPDLQYVVARSNMVRVEFSRLDHLLNLVGELVIYRTKLHEIGRQIASQLESDGEGRDLLDAVRQIDVVSAEIQETVMDIRMLPIRNVFERFPRLVRDIARQQGKEIDLIVEGEGTRVDKAIIDEIGEPLVHLVRNAVDHGIEPPARRTAAGKTASGTIVLSASQESNTVVITVMDDGAGIDPAQVRRKAVASGLLKGHESLTDRELLQLVFAKGLSTAEEITDVSGRGVGLDVVLKSIERLNGMVDVESTPGLGTRFVIRLPLTLAIISALLVTAAKETYAVPLAAVVESIKLRPDEVSSINGHDTLRIRDRIVPLVRLVEIFDVPGDAAAGRQYAVILGRGDRRLGLVVDRLEGQQEVVIKALDASLSGDASTVAGATIMGDGRVVLILDVAAMFEGRRPTWVESRDRLRTGIEA